MSAADGRTAHCRRSRLRGILRPERHRRRSSDSRATQGVRPWARRGSHCHDLARRRDRCDGGCSARIDHYAIPSGGRCPAASRLCSRRRHDRRCRTRRRACLGLRRGNRPRYVGVERSAAREHGVRLARCRRPHERAGPLAGSYPTDRCHHRHCSSQPGLLDDARLPLLGAARICGALGSPPAAAAQRPVRRDRGDRDRAAGRLDPRSDDRGRARAAMTPFEDASATSTRPGSRFLVFGLAAIIAIAGLTTRLFYLQLVSGGELAALTETNREVAQAIPSTRGLIYDRSGRALVTNVKTFAVKIRPVDLPEERRDEVVARLAALLKINIGDINAAIDSNPGSRFDLVRIATDVPDGTASFIAENGEELPGVEVTVETRRQYSEGPLVSQILGYTGPVAPDQLEDLKAKGYLPDDLIGRSGLEAYYEDELRGTYGSETVERDATGRKLDVLETTSQPKGGDSLRLTIDVKAQQN